LEDTGILVQVTIHNSPVWVKALVLKPRTFGTVPIYLLTTDVPQNDFLARTITHKLYDAEPATRVAQEIVLGIGGAKVVDELGGAAIYHMNEAHALPLAFHLFDKFRNLDKVKEQLVFTTHTPEKAGNEEHDIHYLNSMSFFGRLTLETAREITGMHGQIFNHTLATLRLAKVANGVSQLHGEVARDMWKDNQGLCEIKAITNGQNEKFWADKQMRLAFINRDDEALVRRKVELKRDLFEVVADQTGKLFKPDVLTIVWARRFAAYKRADLLLRDQYRFLRMIENKRLPVQVIWAGKPYPFDVGAIEIFNDLVRKSYQKENFAVLTGYEIELSRKLKQGSDIWLNTPRRPREASGTSGMTAAMNGSINVSVQDGWMPEYAIHKENSFLLPIVDTQLPIEIQDDLDHENLMNLLEKEIIPAYYQDRAKWLRLMKNSMATVTPRFGADRMADEYYRKMYQEERH
ncbi:MAG TPA: alpha-glucan family phosphorylase, partial [Adhaeribacter sp.]|nr:alpha-glucan family phosphorylase [Adhaeribacter sp.]